MAVKKEIATDILRHIPVNYMTMCGSQYIVLYK